MKCNLTNALTAALLFLMPAVSFGQTITLGTAANFVLFTTNGAMSNSGTPHLTHLTGHVGSNLAGSVTGFGNVDGQMHAFDVISGVAVADVLIAYNQLHTATPTAAHSVSLGAGETITAGVYAIPGDAMLSSNLILDAQGNPNAVFIFQIQGTLSTAAQSKIILTNGALACNVYWKVEGMVNLATGTTMRGTIIANNAAINISALDTLEGRALAINGAVSVSQLVAYKPLGCGSPILTGPAAPPLGDAAIFSVFSSIGGVTSTPITYVTGDVGSNSTTTTGFNPLFVTGMIHANPDAATAAAAGSLTIAYNILNTLPFDIDLLDPANFGFDLVLTPHTYRLNAATVLTGNVYLNAQGNPDAVFIIQVNGAFTTGTSSKIILINGAQAKNVYWKINGATHIYDNSVFNGTIVGAGAITLNTGDTLNGRALTINGAIEINGSYVTIIDALCVASAITGANPFCVGSTITLSNIDGIGTWESDNTLVATVGASTGIVSGLTAGSAVITYTSPLACTDTVTVIVNPLPDAGTIAGPSSVCVSSSITLTNAVTGGTWSSSNATATVVGGVVTGVTAGIDTIRYSVTNGCGIDTATAIITINPLPNAGTIAGPASVCVGSSITLTDAVTGGTWSSSNATATVVGGVVTGVTAGIDTIRYSVTNGCGIDTATAIITINPLPNAGTIAGPASVCVGSSITLTDAVAGGTWTSSNATATVVGGVVTGVTAGIDTIRYSVTNGCGIDTATAIITINPLPNAGTIAGPSSVCAGSSITLTNAVTGGTWSSSNATATVVGGVVTGVAAGIDTIRYSVTNGCGIDTETAIITINPLPDAGTISGPAAVCTGGDITLESSVTGGTWTSTNHTTTVSAGIVTGITAGTDTISYSVTNGCGTATAIKIITVSPIPQVPDITTQSPPSVCNGTMYQNFGTATLPPENITYDWTAINATVWAQGTSHQYALVSFTETGTAYVSLNVTMTGTGCTNHNSVEVNVSATTSETPTVSYFNNHFVCTPNNEASYQWGYDDVHSLDSTLLEGEINQDYINTNPDFSGRHYWVMTTMGSCLQKTYYYIPTSVSAFSTEDKISIYPNPAHALIHVAITSVMGGDIRVELLNMTGQRISTIQATDNKATMDVASLPAGYYIIHCYRNDIRIAVSKFIKN